MDQPWGTQKLQPPEPGQMHAAHQWLLGAAIVTTISVGSYLGDYADLWRLHKAALIGMPVASLLCWCGWIIRSAESRVRQEFGDQGAELSVQIEQLRGMLANLTSARAQPIDHPDASGSAGEAVGIQRTNAAAVRAAREAGIEEGFEIGIRANLAECGVTPLPTRRWRP